MKVNKEILISKNRFKVPTNYFNNKISIVEKRPENLEGFKVPKGYFEDINKQQIFNRIYIDKIKFIKTSFYKFSAVAAMFIGLIYLPNFLVKNEININADEIINYVNEDFMIMENSEYSEIMNSKNLDFDDLISGNDIENYFVYSSINIENIIFD